MNRGMKSPLFAGRHVHAVPKKGYIVSLIKFVYWYTFSKFALRAGSTQLKDLCLVTSITRRLQSITLYAHRAPLDATARARMRWLYAYGSELLNAGNICGPPHTMVSNAVLLS